MRRIAWSNDALGDLDDVIASIATDNPNAAIALIDRIEAAATMLAEMPVGRIGRVTGTHEWYVRRTPYILAYSFSDSVLSIVRVIHSARDWRPDQWPADS